MTRARDLASRGGLTQIIPTSITVGSGTGSVSANGSITLTGATNISLINCFSSTYDNYKFIFSGTSATAGNVVSYQIGGNTSSEYKFVEIQTNSGGSTLTNTNYSNTNTTGRLGVNAFTAAGNAFNTQNIDTDPSVASGHRGAAFVSPGAPRAGWLGVRYEFK